MAKSRTDSEWNMSREREFMENLLCQRFNFLTLMFSVIVMAAVDARSQAQLTIVLAVGLGASILVGAGVYRICVKVHLILRRLHKKPGHPVRQIREDVELLGPLALRNTLWIIGLVIPLLFCILFLLGTIFAWLGILRAVP